MTTTMTAADRLELSTGLDFNADEDTPVYTINAVSEALGVHPETLRVWERRGVIATERDNNRRLFSRNDVLRLEFVRDLLDRGFNLYSIREYLRFYPCWSGRDEELCRLTSPGDGILTRECWKYPGRHCSLGIKQG